MTDFYCQIKKKFKKNSLNNLINYVWMMTICNIVINVNVYKYIITQNQLFLILYMNLNNYSNDLSYTKQCFIFIVYQLPC